LGQIVLRLINDFNSFVKDLLKFYSVDISALIIRLSCGIISFVHGIQNFYESRVPPGTVKDESELVLVLEFASILYCIQSLFSLALILGWITRKIALLLIVVMIASSLVHNIFLTTIEINFNGNAEELALKLLLVSSFFILFILGGGKCSVDNIKKIK
jgi:uncharacterized membrane protein YphA (DoxX/SURF4 family)